MEIYGYPSNIYIYYTALLNAVERIHLHGPSRLPVVNYFSMTVAMHITVKESHVFRQRQCLWRTISLLINTTNAGNK